MSTPDGDAVPRYRASVVAVDGYADLAVVLVDRALDGGPLTATPVLTNAPLGALAEADKDDEVRVIGYPVSGDSLSPTVERGTVVSKPNDPAGKVKGAWELNTSARIHGGNSGGLVVDERGRLIAIPTYRRGLREQVYRARAAELAAPLLQAARSRAPYTSPHLVKLTGKEQLVDVTWSDVELGETCEPSDGVTTIAAPDALHVQARLNGLADGEDFRLVVTDENGDERTSLQLVWEGRGCIRLSVQPNVGDTVEPGTYTLRALAGPTSKEIGTSTVTVVEAG